MHPRFVSLALAVAALSVMRAHAQRTYRRECECEYTVNGRCAYTLMLPASATGSGNGNGACPRDVSQTERVNAEVTSLRDNVTALLNSSLQLTSLMTQLQAHVLQQRGDIIASNDNAKDALACCGEGKNNVSDIRDELSAVQEDNIRQMDTIRNRLDALVAAITSASENLSRIDDVRKQSARLENETAEAKRRLRRLEGLVCARRGLLVSGSVVQINDSAINASSVYNESFSLEGARLANSTAPFGSWCPSELKFFSFFVGDFQM